MKKVALRNGDWVVRKNGKWVQATTADYYAGSCVRVWFKGKATGRIISPIGYQ